MDIGKSVQRIGWRLSSGNSFKPNNNDIEAFNGIVDYVQSTRRGIIEKQQCFAKLYIFLFGELIKKYNTTIFDPIPQKELSRILNTDLNFLIQDFTDKLNNSESYNFFIDAGVKDFGENHPIEVSVRKKNEDMEKIKAQLKKEGKERFLGKVWSREAVSDNLLSIVNKAIEIFNE